jgi:hypothetical protein
MGRIWVTYERKPFQLAGQSDIQEASYLKILHMVLGLMVLLGAASAAGHFTLKLDVDTYIDTANADKAFSGEKILWATSSGGTPTKETYLGFVNSFGTAGTFSPNDVSSATLKVHVADVEKPGKVAAYFLHGATLESLTWSDRPEYDNETTTTFDVSKAGDYTLDATNIVKKAVEACTEGCPFSVVLVADGDTSVGFSSSEDSGASKAELSYNTPE